VRAAALNDLTGSLQMTLRYMLAAVMAALLPASTALSAGAPSGFIEATFQGRSPELQDGIVSFTLMNGDCSKKDYGDGRGESDCKNGNLRSQVHTRNKQKLGNTYEYSMDIWIDPTFNNFTGFGQPRSPLLIAEWQRINTIKNHMYELHLDTMRGLQFEDKNCFTPEGFGEWHRFKMVAKWSKRSDGFLQVYCDDELVYELAGQQTAIPPLCGEEVKMQCVLELQNLRQPISWQVGPKLGGFGMEYAKYGMPTQFRRFPDSGLHMKIRNLYYGLPRR
jgi:hypothetical protein